jgi:hypothetical protein
MVRGKIIGPFDIWCLEQIIRDMRDNGDEEPIEPWPLTEFAITLLELIVAADGVSEPVLHIISAALLCGLAAPDPTIAMARRRRHHFMT